MKKILVLFVSLLFATSLISCSDDDETNQLIGKWKMISDDACEAKSTLTLEKETFTILDYSIESNGIGKTCKSTGLEGTYLNKDSKLILSIEGSSISINLTYTISGNLLTLVSKEGNGSSETKVFKKI